MFVCPIDAICLLKVLLTLLFLYFGTLYIEIIISERIDTRLKKITFKDEKGRLITKAILKALGFLIFYRLLAVTLVILYFWTNGYFNVLFQVSGGSWEYVELIIKGIAFGLAISFFTTLILSFIFRIINVRLLETEAQEGYEDDIVELLRAKIDMLLQAITASINEEFIFRGFLLLGLYVCFHYSVVEAIVFQAVIFSMLHKTSIKEIADFIVKLLYATQLKKTRRAYLLAFTLFYMVYLIYGLILGILFESERNLIVPIIVHTLYNIFHGVYLQQYMKREVIISVNGFTFRDLD